MKSPIRYNAVFLYASLQSVGHTTEYFSSHTQKLAVFYVMPRVNGMPNVFRLYGNGKLILEKKATSSRNIFLYYVLWLYHHIVFLLRFFNRSDRVMVLGGHPIVFFGLYIMKALRNVVYAYWVGDFYPPTHWSLVAFERLKKFYHDRVEYTFYLSDLINQKLNGTVVRTPAHRTVMWGMERPEMSTRKPGKILRLLFVGVIKPGQGIEDVITYAGKHPDVRLSVIGACGTQYFADLALHIRKAGVHERIFFPNTFYPDDKLRELARDHHIGIALYTDSPKSASFYTDPGKIKTYLELGLPVVMTDTSPIAPYISKFRCGELVSDRNTLEKCLDAIQKKYHRYQDGVKAIARYFAYEAYYRDAFRVFEMEGRKT